MGADYKFSSGAPTSDFFGLMHLATIKFRVSHYHLKFFYKVQDLFGLSFVFGLDYFGKTHQDDGTFPIFYVICSNSSGNFLLVYKCTFTEPMGEFNQGKCGQ